jgi:hypothetical protein
MTRRIQANYPEFPIHAPDIRVASPVTHTQFAYPDLDAKQKPSG